MRAGATYNIRLKQSSGTEEILNVTTWTEVDDLPVAGTTNLSSDQSGTYTISSGGTEAGYHVYDGNGRTITGGSPGISIEASYVIVRNFVVKDAGDHGIKLGDVHHVVLDNCDISGWGRKASGSCDGNQLGKDDDAGAYSGSSSLRQVTVQNCTIHHPRYSANSWACGHPHGPQGIVFEVPYDDHAKAKANHVIRYNRIYSNKNHMYNDCMGQDKNRSYSGFPIRDTDIHDNVCSHAYDDALEIEGGNMNVRVWGNDIDTSKTYFGLSTTAVGPLYLFRNVVRYSHYKGWRTGPAFAGLKFGSPSSGTNHNGDPHDWFNHGPIFIYHNTMRNGGNHGSTGGLINTSNEYVQHNIISRNNIFYVTGGTSIDNSKSQFPNCDFDYDLHNGSVPDGSQAHGVYGSPSFDGDSDVLRESSKGHDDGVVLYNFNDRSSAWAYYGEGPDMGARERKEIPDDDTPPPAPAGLTAVVKGSSRTDLSWGEVEDAQSGIQGYVIYRDGVRIGESQAPAYTDNGLTEGTTHDYRVAAVNRALMEGGKSDEVSATTTADTQPPAIVSVESAGDPTIVTVRFSESVEPVSAQEAANYTIGPGVTVVSATLEQGQTRVVLETSELSDGAGYTLAVSGVKDQARVANEANDTRDFTFAAFAGLGIREASATVSVDGEEDGAWSSIESRGLKSQILGATTADDCAGSVKALWDNENLYVFIAVVDDARATSDAHWENDGVEVYIDGDNAKSSTYDANDYQFRFVRGSSTALDAQNGAEKVPEISAASAETGEGYNIETAIPWAHIGVTAVRGLTVGFDVHVADNDGAGRESKLALFSTNDNTWQDPSLMGEARLYGTATAPGSVSIASMKGTGALRVRFSAQYCLLDVPSTVEEMVVFDVRGALRHHRGVAGKTVRLDRERLSSGTYIVQIRTVDQAVLRKRVVFP